MSEPLVRRVDDRGDPPFSPFPSSPFSSPSFSHLPLSPLPSSSLPLTPGHCSIPYPFPLSNPLLWPYTSPSLLPGSQPHPTISRVSPSCSPIISPPVSPAADAQLFIMIERRSAQVDQQTHTNIARFIGTCVCACREVLAGPGALSEVSLL